MCTLPWHLVYQPNASNLFLCYLGTDFDNSCGQFEARNNKRNDHIYFSLSLASKVNICWWTLFPEILSQSNQSINSSTSQWSLCSLFFDLLFVCYLCMVKTEPRSFWRHSFIQSCINPIVHFCIFFIHLHSWSCPSSSCAHRFEIVPAIYGYMA